MSWFYRTFLRPALFAQDSEKGFKKIFNGKDLKGWDAQTRGTAAAAIGQLGPRALSAVPALVATLCICIVFIPVVFISGAARSLFTPLGMADAVSNPTLVRGPNHAARHARLGPPVVGMGRLEVVAPEETALQADRRALLTRIGRA